MTVWYNIWLYSQYIYCTTADQLINFQLSLTLCSGGLSNSHDVLMRFPTLAPVKMLNGLVPL